MTMCDNKVSSRISSTYCSVHRLTLIYIIQRIYVKGVRIEFSNGNFVVKVKRGKNH